jgi:DNA processing protein
MASDAAYLIALTNIFGIGPVGALSVARTFKTPDALESASSAELDKALGERWASAIRGQLKNGWQSLLTKSQNVVSEHLKSGIRPIAVTEDEYPPLLRLIPDPPPVLYAKGNIPLLKVLDAVAVIGTRKPTTGGTKVASKVAGHLASSGFVIVSGLARGIDSAAHRAACDAGFTIAVLANPLDKVYPAENRELAENIVEGGGTLVAELPKGEPTYRNAFVRRDRIQSGMSLAIIPVQTDVEGGTMHTVRFAEAQHRLLFCPKPLPEESERKEYAGIWQLIRSNRAIAFQSREDYTDVISRIREQKAKWIDEYHLIDTPILPRPKSAEMASKPKDPADKLEELCRALGLDTDKKRFNAVLAKVRNRLFGKGALNKDLQRDEKQQALIYDENAAPHSIDSIPRDVRSIPAIDKEYILYCDRSAILKEHPYNLGIDEAFERAEDLRKQGWKIRFVDTAQMTKDERYAAYLRATTPAMKNKSPIRQVFGSLKQSGFMFGLGVPALVVQTPSGEVLDVFPHRQSERIVTINAFLSRLAGA